MASPQGPPLSEPATRAADHGCFSPFWQSSHSHDRGWSLRTPTRSSDTD